MSLGPEAVRFHEGVGDFLGEVLASMHSIIGSSRWTMERLQALLEPGDCSVVATSDEGDLIGFALAYRALGLNPFLYPERCVILRRLMVTPAFQGRGTGTQLLQNACQRAAPEPLAWQTSTRNSGALAWFAHSGLFPQGQITRGDEVDEIFWIATAPTS